MSGSIARVAVLASGRGTNFDALCAAAAREGFPARIARLVCNRPGAGAFDVAARHGVPATLLDHKEFAARQAHEEAVAAALEADAPDIVCLAGYMRILSPAFVARFEGRMLNIHPSLLPLFPGTHTHERALEAGVTIHGATVHFVTAELDMGPIVAQAAIPVMVGDTPETLAARLLPVENRLYPHALALVASGAVRMQEGRAVRSGATTAAGDALFSPPEPGA